MAPTHQALVRFETVGEDLDPALRAELLALGPAAIPGLLRFLEDDELWDVDSPSEGYAPLHAVDLLVELRATETIDTMLDALCDTVWDENLHDRLIMGLRKLGAPVLEPALARLAATEDEVAREGLCAVLADLGIRDSRIFDALSALFARNPVQGAIAFGEYGDPAALPLLARAIEEFDLDPKIHTLELPSLVEAHESIAPLPPALRARVDEMFELVEEAAKELPPVPVVRVSFADEKLDPDVRAQVLALGAEAVPGLLQILEHEELNRVWAAVHAAELLIELKAVEAIDPLLSVLCETDWDDWLHERLIQDLPKLGAAVVEPALALLSEDLSEDARDSVCSVIADLGVRDQRIYEQLSALYADNPFFGSICLGDYGDPAAVPMIVRAIEQFTPDSSGDFGRIELQGYMEAHQKLAPLSPELRARTDELFAAVEAARRAHEPARRPANQVGRNDPCSCGSGIKFKKCCMGKSAP